jgi:hypothetical protein
MRIEKVLGLALIASLLLGLRWLPVGGPATVNDWMYWGAGAMEVDGTGCAAHVAVELVSGGPKPLTIACSDSNTATIQGSGVIHPRWDGGTLTFTLILGQIAASTLAYEMDFEAQCVSSGESYVDFDGVGEQPAQITLVADDKDLKDETPAVTPDGTTCQGKDTIAWQGAIDAGQSGSGIEDDAVVVGVLMQFQRYVGG